jgi:hypothetical protein
VSGAISDSDPGAGEKGLMTEFRARSDEANRQLGLLLGGFREPRQEREGVVDLLRVPATVKSPLTLWYRRTEPCPGSPPKTSTSSQLACGLESG